MLLYSISDCIAIFLESSEIASGLSKSSTAFLMLVKHLVTPIIEMSFEALMASLTGPIAAASLKSISLDSRSVISFSNALIPDASM